MLRMLQIVAGALPGWLNWYTRRSQKPGSSQGIAGSTPVPGTTPTVSKSVGPTRRSAESAGPTEAIKNYYVELRRARKMFASGEHMAAFMIMGKAAGHLAEHLDVENEDLGAPAIALCSDLFSLYDGQQTKYLRQHTSVGRGGRRMPIALQAIQAEAAYVMDQLMRSGLSKDESAKAAAATMERAGYRFERRNSNPVSAVMYWYEQCTVGAAHDQLSRILFKRLRAKRDNSTSPMLIDPESRRRFLLEQLTEQTRTFVGKAQTMDPDGAADEEGEKRDA